MKKNRHLQKPKSKKQITLTNLYNSVMAVAKEKGESYIQVRVVMDHKGLITLDGYINGSNWEDGLTINEVCDKLRRSSRWQKAEPVSIIKEVFIWEEESV